MSAALAALGAAVGTAVGVPSPRPVSGPIDFEALAGLADRHQVNALVHRSGWLAAAGAPAEVVERLAERARAEAFFSLRLLGLQREVLAACAARGIEPLVLKGAALAHEAYGHASGRMARDVDLLVAPDAVPQAVDALLGAGLAWSGWGSPVALARIEHLPMQRDATLERDGLKVEVHWRLFENRRLMPVDPAWLREPTRVDIDGVAVATLPLADHWRYVLFHGGRHQWTLMKWLADVAALAVRHPQLAAPDALRATPAGDARAVASGLLVAEAALGRFLTPASRAWAEGVRGTGVLVRRSLAVLAAARERGSAPFAAAGLPGEVASRLALRADAAYRAEELRVMLLTAGRSQEVEDPGLGELVRAPARWVRRLAARG